MQVRYRAALHPETFWRCRYQHQGDANIQYFCIPQMIFAIFCDLFFLPFVEDELVEIEFQLTTWLNVGGRISFPLVLPV